MLHARYALLRAILIVIPFLSFFPALHGQDTGPWYAVNEAMLDGRGERRIVPARYRTVGVDLSALRATLAEAAEADVRSAPWTILLPLPEGGAELFRFAEAPVMHPGLAERFPAIRTYAGQSVERNGVTVRFDLTPHGFHALVMDPHDGMYFIDPYAFGMDDACIVYRKAAFSKQLPEGFTYCAYGTVNDVEQHQRQVREWTDAQPEGGVRAGDCQKRTYRLALACTGEYANYHGSNTGNNDKSFALAAMVTSMNRVNGIYERDMTLTMQLVPNNDQLIFLNPATDPYTNNSGSTMLNQNQTTCNTVIGSANYDIGHVFSTGGGGIAQLYAPCGSGKARGVTGLSNPVGDPFDVDYVAHEMGHQYGANHTQNNACQRAAVAAYEPGSASTIMGYAGICSPNVQNFSDALFHAFSLQEMSTFLAGAGGSCPVTEPSGNQPPTVDAGPDRTIPRSTPFILTATASDPDPGTALTYTWEQMNNEVSPQPPSATSTIGPNFRALLPSTSPQRYLPNLNAVVANQNPTWEVLSSVSRNFNFRITVRDNNPLAGCTDEDNMVVTVDGNSGPFVVTQPNTNVSWQAGSTQTVTWNVAGTTAAPVSCASVDILLSVDGGFTYPHILLAGTPNDGTQSVTLPVIPATTTARVMVRAAANIFYDIGNTNFTITAAPAPPALAAKVVLEGPYVGSTGLMIDSLRQSGLVPFVEPYTALGWPQLQGGGENTSPQVLAVTGNDAVVDWVRVELRSTVNAAEIVATRQGLLQRDGDVVAADGVSPLTFGVPAGSYHVAVRHRNHLGCMTADPVTLGATPLVLDFRTFATATFGTDARKDLEGVAALWAGNVLVDDILRYTGADNDRDPILVAIGGGIPTLSVNGYLPTDVNLDGLVKYTGAANDRDPILLNIGGTVPTAERVEQLP